jgi:hypothetical protein
MNRAVYVKPMHFQGLAALGAEEAATTNPVWDALLSVPGIVAFQNTLIYSNPRKMRTLFAETTRYPTLTNYGDFRYEPPPGKIDQWIKEAEAQIMKNVKGQKKDQSLVDIVMNTDGVPPFVKDMVRSIQQGWPDRMVYSPAQGFPVDSPRWTENESMAQTSAALVGAAINAVASIFGSGFDPTQLLKMLVAAVIFIGDYVRENYKASREAGYRQASKDRREKMVAAYKANFGNLMPSLVTQKAWGNHSDPYALPDGTTKKYLDDKAQYDKEMAALTAMSSFTKLTGQAEQNARLGIHLLQQLAQSFKREDFYEILFSMLNSGNYNGQTNMVNRMYDLVGAQDELAREYEIAWETNEYYGPAWEDTKAGNFNWKARDNNARKKLAQWTMSTFSTWSKEVGRERPWNLRRFEKWGGSKSITQVMNDCVKPIWEPFFQGCVKLQGKDNAQSYAYDQLRAMHAHTGGGGPPGEPLNKVAMKLLFNKWELPVEPQKGTPSRCPTGGTACLPCKTIVGRLPIGAKPLPDLPKSPKSMTVAERKAFAEKLQQLGYPDYYIECILLNPSDWYEGVPSGSGLAGLGEDAPFYKQTWYWLAVAGVVGGYLYYRKR